MQVGRLLTFGVSGLLSREVASTFPFESCTQCIRLEEVFLSLTEILFVSYSIRMKLVILISALFLLSCGSNDDGVGFIFIEWDIEQGRIDCDGAGGTDVRLEISAGGQAVDTLTFPCSAGEGLSSELSLGTYSVRTELLGVGGVAMASYEATAVALTQNDLALAVSLSFEFENNGDLIRYLSACDEVAKSHCAKDCPGWEVDCETEVLKACCGDAGLCGGSSLLTSEELVSCVENLDCTDSPRVYQCEGR